MEYGLLKDLIQSIGFPIFVAVYLLVEFKKTLNKVNDTIEGNTQVLVRLCEKIDKLEAGMEKEDKI